jgi:hypothetical protein
LVRLRSSTQPLACPQQTLQALFTIAGKISIAPRRWTSAAGIAAIESTFTLPLQWNVETNVMAYDGTPLLAPTPRVLQMQAAVRAFDAGPSPSTADAQICRRIIELAPLPSLSLLASDECVLSRLRFAYRGRAFLLVTESSSRNTRSDPSHQTGLSQHSCRDVRTQL